MRHAMPVLYIKKKEEGEKGISISLLLEVLLSYDAFEILWSRIIPIQHSHSLIKTIHIQVPYICFAREDLSNYNCTIANK